MKLAVINFSGNVGKTTVARHLLAPLIAGAEVVSVESMNADDTGAAPARSPVRRASRVPADRRDVVVDVGASNVEDLLALMRRYHDSHEDFDGFVVPTVPALKQQQDTAATLLALNRLGVAARACGWCSTWSRGSTQFTGRSNPSWRSSRGSHRIGRHARPAGQQRDLPRVNGSSGDLLSWRATRPTTRPRLPRPRRRPRSSRWPSGSLRGAWPAASFPSSTPASHALDLPSSLVREPDKPELPAP